MATFAIGNVHGSLVALQNLVELIFPEMDDGNTLVFLTLNRFEELKRLVPTDE